MTTDSTAEAKIDEKLLQLGLTGESAKGYFNYDDDNEESSLERRILAEADLAEKNKDSSAPETSGDKETSSS